MNEKIQIDMLKMNPTLLVMKRLGYTFLRSVVIFFGELHLILVLRRMNGSGVKRRELGVKF
jgi:hypothetical protein